MKKKFILAIFTLIVTAVSACKKENELSPRQEGSLIEYTIPAPTFLTAEERAILDAKRAEWDNL